MAIDTGAANQRVWEPPNAVQIRVTLLDIDPAVWRQLVVPVNTTQAGLHLIFQAAFGWRDCHLHYFDVGGLRYGDSDFFDREDGPGELRTFEASEVRLRDFHIDFDGGPVIEYVYDFGDNWVHAVLLEKELALTPAPKAAVCTGGARCCPPEDVGGPPGYFEFLRVLLSPEPDEIDEQKHLKRWSGGKFDPKRFDLVKTDKAVRGALRRRPTR